MHRWSPGKNPTNTVHVDDVAGGAWACANWIAPIGRKAADAIAGVPIAFHNDKSKISVVDGMLPYETKPLAPLFNLVSSFLRAPMASSDPYLTRLMTRILRLSALAALSRPSLGPHSNSSI